MNSPGSCLLGGCFMSHLQDAQCRIIKADSETLRLCCCTLGTMTGGVPLRLWSETGRRLRKPRAEQKKVESGKDKTKKYVSCKLTGPRLQILVPRGRVFYSPGTWGTVESTTAQIRWCLRWLVPQVLAVRLRSVLESKGPCGRQQRDAGVLKLWQRLRLIKNRRTGTNLLICQLFYVFISL